MLNIIDMSRKNVIICEIDKTSVIHQKGHHIIIQDAHKHKETVLKVYHGHNPQKIENLAKPNIEGAQILVYYMQFLIENLKY